MKDLRAALNKQPPHRHGPVEPIPLFRALKIRPGSGIKEMWAPQADALREWDAHRMVDDVLFQLNTGAGKTLIGLVAAQSLVNETRGKVIYCCVTRQLVEQTRAQPEELG
jgi:replicative superfamily II helicase